METQIHEIAPDIYRLSTLTQTIPGGFTFNPFLVLGNEPLLSHTGPRQLFNSVAEVLATVMPIGGLR